MQAENEYLRTPEVNYQPLMKFSSPKRREIKVRDEYDYEDVAKL